MVVTISGKPILRNTVVHIVGYAKVVDAPVMIGIDQAAAILEKRMMIQTMTQPRILQVQLIHVHVEQQFHLLVKLVVLAKKKLWMTKKKIQKKLKMI